MKCRSRVANDAGTTPSVEVAPESQTRELSTTLLPFELLRTAITQHLMQPLPIIEPLDIIDNRGLGLSLILKLPMVHHLVLQRTKEALHWGIVIAVALPTHTGDHAELRASDTRSHDTDCLGHYDAPGLGGWSGSVGDQREPRRRPRAFARTHGPPHDTSGIEIE